MVNVLLTYTGLIPSVRFCALEPLRQLEKEGRLSLTHKISYDITSYDLNNCDVLVLVRCGEDCELKIARKCKNAGRQLIYVLDDDLFNVPSDIECHAYYSLEIIRKNISRIMELCDVLWTPNPNLIKKYGHMFEKSVLIDEPFIGRIYTKEKENDTVKIGFAGSPTHKSFVNGFMGDVLKEIKCLHGEKVSIDFFGFKPQFADQINAEYIPYCDSYEKYCELMRERCWDIGLAPLEESEFSSCKYFNKYIEYSSYSIAGVYSEAEPYTFAIQDGVNGILAKNTPAAWVAAINRLVSDKELTRSISLYARNELKTRFNVESVARIIFQETQLRPCDKEKKTIRYKKSSFAASKLMLYMKMYGIKAPFMVIRKLFKKLFISTL